MKPQHLSDEAVAAFADGVLRGYARDRASRHTADCAECAHAVAVQREAVWALRTAPAPALPTDLLDRLRGVPASTPLRLPPTALAQDGSTLLATFGSMSRAALVPPQQRGRSVDHAHVVRRRLGPIAGTAAAVAVAGVIAVGSAAHASGPMVPQPPLRQPPAGIVAPVSVHDVTGR